MSALERLGFKQVRQTGSHVRLVRGNLYVTVPYHDSVAPGTLRNILRQAQIDLATFIENLR